MEDAQRQTTAVMAEQLLEIGILAMKGFIFMLWIQSMASPIQFFVGGLLVLLAAYLLSWHQSSASSASTSPSLAPAHRAARKTVRFHEQPDEEARSDTTEQKTADEPAEKGNTDTRDKKHESFNHRAPCLGMDKSSTSETTLIQP
jgi:hypothetical protein